MISLFSLDVGAQSRRSRDQSSGSVGSARPSRSASRGASVAAVGDDSEVDSAGRKPCPKCGKRYNVSLWFERHYRDCKGPAGDNTGKALIEFSQGCAVTTLQ